jgi:hypothetical protein
MKRVNPQTCFHAVVDLRVDSELELAGVLEDLLRNEVVDEKSVDAVVRELLQVVVTVVPDEEHSGRTYWCTPGAMGLEKDVPARAARLNRLIICLNAISAGGLQ